MAMATTPGQLTMLCSSPITGQIPNRCMVPCHLKMASFSIGGSGQSRMGTRVEAKLGKATKTAPSTDSEKKWIHHGLVTESLPNGMFRVGLVNFVDNKFVRVNEEVMLGYVSGKIRTNHIRIVPGDIVRVEIGPYDSQKGRIVYRLSRRDMDKLTGREESDS